MATGALEAVLPGLQLPSAVVAAGGTPEAVRPSNGDEPPGTGIVVGEHGHQLLEANPLSVRFTRCLLRPFKSPAAESTEIVTIPYTPLHRHGAAGQMPLPPICVEAHEASWCT